MNEPPFESAVCGVMTELETSHRGFHVCKFAYKTTDESCMTTVAFIPISVFFGVLLIELIMVTLRHKTPELRQWFWHLAFLEIEVLMSNLGTLDNICANCKLQ